MNYYFDQSDRDRCSMYTYEQIGKIKLVAPETARLLRSWYSSVLASGDTEDEIQAGLEIERVYNEYSRELYQKGYIQ